VQAEDGEDDGLLVARTVAIAGEERDTETGSKRAYGLQTRVKRTQIAWKQPMHLFPVLPRDRLLILWRIDDDGQRAEGGRKRRSGSGLG
jgi:hypothetical protein